MHSGELVHYACYGSMTREVAETLLNRRIDYGEARIPRYGIRMLTHQLMSDAEREVVQGGSRFIVVSDRRYTRGVRGGIVFGLPREQASILQAFDNTSKDEYEVLRHTVVAVTRRPTGDIETPLPAILVARKKMYGRNWGEWRDPQKYDPYEPFGVMGRYKALAVAEEVREVFLNDPKAQ